MAIINIPLNTINGNLLNSDGLFYYKSLISQCNKNIKDIMPHVRQGFEGQRMIVFPPDIQQYIADIHPFNNLYITDIGYFPKATFHYVKRDEGSPEHILIYCTEGKGWFITPTSHGVVKPNQYIIVPANMKHRYGANTENPWSIYWVHFRGAESSFFLRTLNMEPGPRAVDIWASEERIKIFDEMYSCLEHGYSKENLGFSNLCLWHFLGTFIYGEQFKNTGTEKEIDEIDVAVQHMKININKNITLEELAQITNKSVSYFSTIFKHKTGFAPIDYFIRLKIQSACQYLDLTQYRIKEICGFLGFNDQYYFSRIFTKIMGESPTQYKMKQKG
jgi:AraC-like DNA-binding protein